MRAASLDDRLIGSNEARERALLDLNQLFGQAYLITEDQALAVVAGQVCEAQEDSLPWEEDDPRPRRGVALARGDHSPDLVLAATPMSQPLTWLFQDRWTMVPHEDPTLPALALAVDDREPAVAISTQGDEVHLWLVGADGPFAHWEWNVTGVLVAVHALPPGDTGTIARDLIFAAREGPGPFIGLEVPVSSTAELAMALAEPGVAADVVPRLTRVLQLPDSARSHLLGESDLATSSDAQTSEPAGSTVGAIRESLIASHRLLTITRTPRRRLTGAIVGAIYLPAAVVVAGLILRDWLGSGRAVELPDVLVLLALVAMMIPAGLAVWSWWRLRMHQQRDPADLPAGLADDRRTPAEHWLDRKVPSTVLCTVLGLGMGAIGVGIFTSEAPLREHGLHSSAQVLSNNDGVALVEFSTSSGQKVTAELSGDSEHLATGSTVDVVYDPQQPTNVQAADAIADPLVFTLLAVGALLFLTLAVLTAVGVIDWQRVNAWWS